MKKKEGSIDNANISKNSKSPAKDGESKESVESMDLEDFKREMIKLLSQYNGPLPFSHLNEVTRLILEHRSKFRRELSDPNRTMNIAKIENMMLELLKGFENITQQVLAENLEVLEKDGVIIPKAKKNPQKRG